MVIDRDGLEEVKKIKDALTHMYDKVVASSADVSEEYSFIFKILGQMETDWSHDVTNNPSTPDELTIDGRVYKRS